MTSIMKARHQSLIISLNSANVPNPHVQEVQLLLLLLLLLFLLLYLFFIYGKRKHLGWYGKLTSKLRFSDRLLRLWNYYFIIFLGRLYCVYYFFVSSKIVHFSAHISVLGQNIINSASHFPYSNLLYIR